jgi:hypothetical protein
MGTAYAHGDPNQGISRIIRYGGRLRPIMEIFIVFGEEIRTSIHFINIHYQRPGK